MSILETTQNPRGTAHRRQAIRRPAAPPKEATPIMTSDLMNAPEFGEPDEPGTEVQ
jgi:hypothetical protein